MSTSKLDLGDSQPDGQILNDLLLHFYLKSPKVVFIPGACDHSPIHSLRSSYTFPDPKWKKEDVPDYADLLPEYSSVVSVLINLVELEFLDVLIETNYLMDFGGRGIGKWTKQERTYQWDKFVVEFKSIDHIVFANILAKICQSKEKEVLHLELSTKRVDWDEKEYITRVTFSLTKAGYDVAMSLAAHKDSQAVRDASISSAKTANRAFWAAICIAIGSLGGLILKICEKLFPCW